MALEVIDDCLVHADRNALRCAGIVCLVQYFEWLNEAQHYEVHGWRAITTIDYPVVAGIEVSHVAHAGPRTKITAAMPGAINGNVIGGSNRLRLYRKAAEECSNDEQAQHRYS